MSSYTVEPANRIEGTLRVPGDKAISHRALLVAAIADGQISIQGLSPSADVWASLRAVRDLGIAVTDDSERQLEGYPPSIYDLDFQVLVDGTAATASGGRIRTPSGPIDVGNSGSTIRMLMGILAGQPGIVAELTGDASIRRRPMGRVVEPLTRMGADIEGADNGTLAPLQVRGTTLQGCEHILPVASAQVKSALIFAGLSAAGATTIEEPAISRDHTERMLRYLGVPIDGSINRHIVRAAAPQGGHIEVPGDLSSAAFLLVAAAILPGSEIRIDRVGVNETRTGILHMLRSFGATVEVTNVVERSGEPVGSVTVRAGERRGFVVGGPQVVAGIDELPLAAVLGAVAEGETIVRDAGELRVKESDRIAAIVDGLRALGVDLQPSPDGFVVRGPNRLRGGVVDAAGDHRIAMALAVAGLAADEPVTIDGWDAVAVSYPGFADDLERVAVR